MYIFCQFPMFRAMIVFVHPVSGHILNLNGRPPSRGITMTLFIIGEGSVFPSHASAMRTIFCMEVYGGWYGGGCG